MSERDCFKVCYRRCSVERVLIFGVSKNSVPSTPSRALLFTLVNLRLISGHLLITTHECVVITEMFAS